MSLQDAVELAMSYDHPCGECAEWRARAEGLEEVLRELVDRYCVANRPVLPASYCLPHEELPTSHDPYCSAARAALARLPADALRERQEMEAKAAQTEALGKALEETLAFADMLGGWDDVDFAAAKSVRAVLARLPAQALAERRALETDAARYRYLREGGLQSSTFGVFNGVSYWGGEQLDATLDAVRREGEHHG